MGSNDNKNEIRKLLKLAEAKGCTIELRNSGHYKITTPKGRPVFCASTPSDYRGVRQTRAQLRQQGVDL